MVVLEICKHVENVIVKEGPIISNGRAQQYRIPSNRVLFSMKLLCVSSVVD